MKTDLAKKNGSGKKRKKPKRRGGERFLQTGPEIKKGGESEKGP